ncbi:MAG: hypothetical protein JWO88_1965 [Frankiales bacterium]|nr:hypothetical protein [Frankiales bacterium]
MRRQPDEPRRRRATAAVLVVTGLTFTAACGSTVSGTTASATGQAPNAQGLGPASQTASSGPQAAAGGVSAGTNGPGATGGAASGQGSANGGTSLPGGSTPGGTASTVQVANGPGVTATTITIGITYYQSAKDANAAFGGKGLDFGDPVAGSRVLVNDINAHGGIAGRKVLPLFYAIDPQSSSPYAALAQAECTYYTEDHKVFAVIDGTPAADARACLAKHGVADLTGKLITSDLASNEIDAYTARLDRMFSALVPALVAQSWFSPWDRTTAQPGVTKAKTGIVTVDDPHDNRAVDGVLIPGLRRAGYPPDPSDVIRIAPPGGFSDDGAVVAAIDAAVLKLNSHGVDHVILNDSNGSLSLLFNSYAYSQNYFPRYGGSTGNGWQVLLDAGDLQPKTLNGAMGIGWQPLFDIPYVNGGTGPGNNATRQRCFKVFKDGGMPATSGATAGAQAEGCDVMYLLPTLFRGYQGPVNVAALLQRLNALGTSYPQASGLGSRFAADQHDGAGAYANLQFKTSCNCFAYAGAAHPMPR